MLIDWQPINTAPRNGEFILLSGMAVEPYTGMYVSEGYGDSRGFSTTQGRLVNQPTHWMPLPEPPNNKQPETDSPAQS